MYHIFMLNQRWFSSVIFLPQTQKPGLTMRETSEKQKQKQVEGHSTKYLTSNTQNCQSLQKQGKSPKFSV